MGQINLPARVTCVTVVMLLFNAYCLGIEQSGDTANSRARTHHFSDVSMHGETNRNTEILVKFRDSALTEAVHNAHLKTGAQVVKRFAHLHGLQIVRASENQTIEELLQLYRQDPAVKFAEPNYQLQILVEPNDPDYPRLWSLNNTGQTGGTNDADINAPQAWDLSTGSSDVVIASIDTGVDYTHPDLAANMWVNPGEIPGNNIDDDGNGYIDDIHGINAIDGSGDPFDDQGHGTHTTGTMGAIGNNGIGIAGVNWRSKIIACKFLNEFGFGFLSEAITCLDYLLDLKTRNQHAVNLVLTNNSWGGGGFSQALYDAIEAHQTADILFVAAAGNAASNSDVRESYPAAYDLPGIIAVAATDHRDNLAPFSNFGRFTIDVAAPGVDILSTVPRGNCDLCDDSGYTFASGTSMAAPHVAGLAALLKSQDASRNGAAIKNLILSGGQSINAVNERVLSSKRIRAADNNGSGSMSCMNQALREILLPAEIVTTAGSTINISAIQINCEFAVSDPITLTLEPGAQTITLVDDGTGVDQIANDGLLHGEFIADTDSILQLPNNRNSTITIVENYGSALLGNANYRNLNPTNERALQLGLDSFATIESPFPIRFGNSANGFKTLYVLSHGVIAFDQPNVDFFNVPLPTPGANTWVAPFWDDLFPGLFFDGDDVYWEVQGSAPNRELIIEYRNLSHFFLSFEDDPGRVTFQVVFFENNSDIVFNYADTDFNSPRYNHGANATIGVQVAGHAAKQFSFNKGGLRGGASLLWQSLQFPEVDAGPEQLVNPAEVVTLDGSAATLAQLGSIVDYQWTQVAGPAVNLINANNTVATFVAPADGQIMQFDLDVRDSDGNRGKGRVTVRTNSRPTAIIRSFTDAVNFGEFGVLDGFDSADPDGNIEAYEWTQIAGDPVTLETFLEIAFFEAPNTPQLLSFELMVTDDLGLSGTTTIDVRVNDPPLADAGDNLNVRVGTRTALRGGGSDSDGEIREYLWEQISGPTTTIDSLFPLPIAHFTPTSTGTYQFRLTVTDNDFANGEDTLTVTVTPKKKKKGAMDVAALALLLLLILQRPCHAIYCRR